MLATKVSFSEEQSTPYTPSAYVLSIQTRARERYAVAQPSPKREHMKHAFFTLYPDLELWERQARSFAYALVREPVYVNPGELIQSMIYRVSDPFCGYGFNQDWGEYNAQHTAHRRIDRELPDLIPYLHYRNGQPRTFIINDDGTPGHIAWRWDWVLRDGLNAIIEQHREAAETADDETARHYYRGVVICLEAILTWNAKHIEAAQALIDGGSLSPDDAATMQRCVQVMTRVPAEPARNFHEALQAYHMMWICAFYEAPYGGNSPGRFDYLLWPFLKDELEAGRISRQEATDLVAETFIKCDEMVHDQDGCVLTIVTGGLTTELKDAVSPLTYMTIDAIAALDVTHPAVYNRLSPENPEAYRRACCDYMLHGGNRGQFLNERALMHALTQDGRMSPADAAMYICGGCMEVNPQGLTSDLFWSFLYNIGKTLELCITGGVDLVDGSHRAPMPSSLADHPSFESFRAYVEAEVAKLLLLKFRALDIHAQEMARLRPQYILSSMIDDCFQRGRNQMDGGARYADYGGAVIGMPNVANNLMAIKRAVYDMKLVTAEELMQALRDNFVGHEPLRLRLRALPKYGEQNPEADAIMNHLLTSVSDTFDSYTTYHGGRCKQVLLTFTFAPMLGAALGATPEGCKAGTPVAHGLTPAHITCGLSTAMQSYLSLDNARITGGASTMWDMDADWINASLLDSVYSVFEDGGGQIFQGNMTDVAMLEKAFENPEAYPSMIVRVGGFSSRFMNLSREVQRDIIERRRWR